MKCDVGKYQKKHDYLICMDSDGTVMDTMSVKHTLCLAPALIEEWRLQAWEEPVCQLWYDINLYRRTRGVNRIKALTIALEEVNNKYVPIDGLKELKVWASRGGPLSAESLKAELGEHPSIILEKTLHWVETVNRRIGELALEDKKPLPGAREGLEAASEFADVVVISTANQAALLTEWSEYNLLKYTNALLGQEIGSKECCIARLLEYGYAPDHVLMIGDSPGDMDAARGNGVWFYPILVRYEADSWRELCTDGFNRLRQGDYGTYEQERCRAFFKNLDAAQ